jgi:hypothetical protein
VFYQTDPELQFKANSDCYLFDILKVHELVGKHEFTREQVKQLRKVSVRADFMGQDGYLNEKGISGIATVASGLTKHHVYIKRVGSNDNYNHIIAKYEYRADSGKFFCHFILANFDKPSKIIDWDPWAEWGSNTGNTGYIIGYRYIFAEAI